LTGADGSAIFPAGFVKKRYQKQRVRRVKNQADDAGTARINRQFVVAKLPSSSLHAENFQFVTNTIPEPAEGEVLLKTRYISLDAANRAWLQGATYRDSLQVGMVMAGGALAEVIASRTPEFTPGERVYAETGWQDYAVISAENVRKLSKRTPESHLLSIYGISGITAYCGLLKCGKPEPRQTVLVSAAAGAVGSIVGQIARAVGCKAVGIAGGAEKCAMLTDELGFDAAIDYKAGSVKQQLRRVCPDSVNVFFDNVGGDIFEAGLFAMASFGRIVCCGAVSAYDGPAPAHGPRGVPSIIVTKRLTVQGFIVFDMEHYREEALTQLEAWVQDGKIKVREDVIEGFENLPDALVGLLAGQNIGKRMVRLV
jgi:NADPH-dependent curcumin reductase CurA